MPDLDGPSTSRLRAGLPISSPRWNLSAEDQSERSGKPFNGPVQKNEGSERARSSRPSYQRLSPALGERGRPACRAELALLAEP